MQKLVIAFAGKIVSGKETASTHIARQYGLDEIDYSDFLEQALSLFCIPIHRKAYTDLSMFLRTTYGDDIFERAVMRKVLSSDRHGAVLQGVRRETDFETLAQQTIFTLVYIEAPHEQRYEWFRARARNVGDSEMSFEEFQERESTEPEQRIERLKERASIVIHNHGSIQEFLDRIQTALDPLIQQYQRQRAEYADGDFRR